MASKGRAKKAPPPHIPSVEEFQDDLEGVLKRHALPPMSPYTVIVEGTTDVRYVKAAAALHAESTGEELLMLPHEAGGGSIGVVTPCDPAQPYRGGVKWVVSLAEEIGPYVHFISMLQGILFVFDHDEAGTQATQKIAQYGFKPETHSLTLNPKEHPGALAKKQVAIEHLLSLDVQARFFESGGTWCSAEYEEGELTCYRWHHNSKSGLCEFVCREGELADFAEVIRLLRRVRASFGLPVLSSVRDV